MENKRKYLTSLRNQLDIERQSFIPHWKMLSDHFLPRRSRFQITDANRGDRRNQNIYDATGTLALRTLRSGMMSGVTSPARPWFRLSPPDPDLSELASVKGWLYAVDQRMSTIFLKSNLYQCLPLVYGDIGCFGTSAMLAEEDFAEVMRFYCFPIGSYWIACDERGKVNVFGREYRMTVRQLIEKFGAKDPTGKVSNWDNFSEHVRDLHKQDKLETWIDVCHFITPNDEYKPDNLLAKYKKFSSCYFEKGVSSAQHGHYIDDDARYLRESGYDYFPVLCSRWEVAGEDIYGTSCPGMEALSDTKSLQKMQLRKSQAIEKMVNPPMVAPTALKTARASTCPGDITYLDERDAQKSFRPAYQVDFRINELTQDIQEHQNRIQRAFFEDLFLMLANSDRRQITAREIDERHEEKLLALGPVLEQLNQDLLDPLIDIAFALMLRQGLIPDPPEELQGADLKVEYTSIMAQAQKLISIGGVERFASFAAQVATVSPESLDKVDTDQMLDVYAEITSLPPGIVRPDDVVANIRQQRAKAQQEQAQAQQVAQSTQSMKNLSQTNLEGENALTRIMSQAQAGSALPV